MQLPALGSDSGRLLLARIIANGIGQTAATWGRVLVIRLAFDRLIGSGALELRSWTWPAMVAALLLAYGGRGWLRRQERIDAERLGQQYAHRVRLLLFEHLTALSPRTLQGRSHGTVMLRFIGDLSALRRWVSRGVARLTVAAITVLGSVAIITLLNQALGLAVALCLALTAGLVLSTARGIRQAVGEVRRRRSHL